jgi:signal transduction histidine kinase
MPDLNTPSSNTNQLNRLDFQSIFESIWKIEKAVLETVNFEESTKKVVNIILTELGYVNHGYEVIVLTLLDQKAGGLRRIAISNTESAGQFLKATPIPFKEIIIPISEQNNLSIRAINEKRKFTTRNVSDVLYPAIDKVWVENFQKTLGIKTTIVFPIIAKDKTLGTLLFSLSKEENTIPQEEWAVLDSFVGAVGIALDNALLFKSLEDTKKQLESANERLKEVDKLKDEFVSLASHELRTPMTVIRSYTWMLLQDKVGILNDKQKSYLQKALRSTEGLINLVNNMLNISRIESGRLLVEKKVFDLDQLVSEIIEELMPKATELGIKLIYVKPLRKLTVNADSDRIREVIINLIGNAFKFTPKDGTIDVIAEEDGKGFGLVKIRDTGRGISQVNLLKLFKKFNMVGNTHLTKDVGQGTGLGLYLSKSLVEYHGGRIWAASDGEGRGSTFSFTLPLFNGATQAPSPVGSDQVSQAPGIPKAVGHSDLKTEVGNQVEAGKELPQKMQQPVGQPAVAALDHSNTSSLPGLNRPE